MKILYVGDDWVGSNARSLADGFREAGHEVLVVDSTPVTLPARLSPPWVYAKLAKRRAPWDIAAVHADIEALARSFAPDLLFAFKTVHLDQRRLLATPAALRVHYSPDDVANPENISADYLAHEPCWDLIVTTKRHNVPELTARGARAVLFVRSAYDPAWHRPCARRGGRYLAGFIGACRPDRRDLVVDLARAHGADLAVYGPGWRRVPRLRRTGAAVRGPVYGERFSVAVAGVTANLVLLNSANRDTHTCRSFEIPAAGGLFVGERTDEHAELLTEDSECFLFSSAAELRDILDRCARHPERAAEVAAAGHRRITGGGHRYVDRAREILDAVE
ncbi:glycosyltransferase [Nocardia terpenica]|uniref:Glycosyl transferase family 1 n=1 Tax=Nocardia terpenica TaxID=455432 RepID=A0A164M9B5_9NOCA|nr:glycosyltransferase [Nocardia terpenica]KZM73160.1 glycosyl transferase family 1 [Nocardia terpenica]MBF6064259.1 glycosyltransferase [Nocardia terpenica]MBF6106592.1 glycosyltransferase [Nocardia terpenica]MBF6113877.1 glycosyltransferase [Nocardia terpenica]MBF6120499.1 glycosyltransferase [Nocardia terpenica]